MFKRIPGNNEFRIDFIGTIVNHSGEIVEIECDDNGFIAIELYGKIRKVKKQIIALLAWYEYGHVHNLSKLITSTFACPCNSPILRISCGAYVMHSKPFEYINGFRYIPSFPRYAINIDGKVIDTQENVIVDKTMTDKDGYSSIYIYNPDKCQNRWTRIHRLMALAWLPNTDFQVRPYVNHIDGNKENFSIENLEWCSLEENSQHAVLLGLNDTNIQMKTRDVVTGEVVHYHSASEMKRKLGLTSVTASAWYHKLPGYLFRRRYEIKRLDDNSPWYYEKSDVEFSKAIFTITVLDKRSGDIMTFISVKSFKKHFKIYTSRNRIEDAVEAFKVKYPEMDITYKRNSVVGPYIVTDIETGAEEEISSMREAASVINIGKSELQFDLSRGLKFIYNGKWIVRPVASVASSDISDFTHKRRAFSKVEIQNTETGEITIAESMRETANLVGVDYKSVRKYIDSGKSFKGYVFRAID